MKVEYFADGSTDCPLVLLYGGDPADARTLSAALHRISESHGGHAAIHDLQGFSSVDGCQLFASLAKSDLGVRRIHIANVFDCSLRAETWENVAELVEPFCSPEAEPLPRYQYLRLQLTAR